MMPRCLSCVFSGPNPLGQSSFKTRAIRFYHFMLNCTGNVSQWQFCFGGTAEGGSWKMEFKDGTKSGITVSTLGDIDIAWPRNAN